MVKLPSDEFIAKIKKMSDRALLRAFDKGCVKMKVLEKERMRCWNRFMKICEIQDELGGKNQCMAVAVYYDRKLRK